MMNDLPEQSPPILAATRVTLKSLAELNRYDIIGREFEALLANGEIADYDDEIANRMRDAIKIVRGICEMAAVPLKYEPKTTITKPG
jgi:hypothetical protein